MNLYMYLEWSKVIVYCGHFDEFGYQLCVLIVMQINIPIG